MFYAPIQAVANPGTQLILRCKLLKREDETRFVGVDPDAVVFHTGDQVRIQIEVNQNASVYLFQRGSSGTWSVLVPQPPEFTGLRLQPFEVYAVPSNRNPPLRFDSNPGEEQLFVLAAKPDAAFDVRALIASLNTDQLTGQESSQAKEASELILALLGRGNRGPQSRDLILEDVAEQSKEQKGYALYISAETNQGADQATVLARLRLKHTE